MYDPRPELDEVATFRVATGAPATLGRRLVAPLIVVFVLLVLLGSLSGNVIIGLGLGVVGTAALGGILTRRLSSGVGTTVLRTSPAGIELLDGQGFGFLVRWRDVTEVGQVSAVLSGQPLMPADLVERAAEGGDAGTGLIGQGSRVIPDPETLPRYLRRRLPPQRADAPLTPVAVPLGAIDPGWKDGAIGDAVRRHRPDLLAPTPGSPPAPA
jgi:hypothetical protein